MILRKEKSNCPFVMVAKDFINDINLSAKAKGILLYMLSKPDDWFFYESEIAENFTDGIKAIKAGIKELIEYKYVTRSQLRDNGNKFSRSEYIIHETSPLCRFRTTENRTTQNGTLLNNELTDNNKTNKEYRLFSNTEKSTGVHSFDLNILKLQIKQAYNQIKVALPFNDVVGIFQYFIKQHQSIFDFEHPKLSKENIQSILFNITTCNNPNGGDFIDLDLEAYKPMIDCYFRQKFNSDYSIVHFMSGDIRANCYFKTLY